MSLPSWERGLKYITPPSNPSSLMSLPSWERGLKSVKKIKDEYTRAVAPFMGAWIEIAQIQLLRNEGSGRSLHGSVDWNSSATKRIQEKKCRSLHGSVDWNFLLVSSSIIGRCRSLHGSVDWNFCQKCGKAMAQRRSLHGSVDWNWLLWNCWEGT